MRNKINTILLIISNFLILLIFGFNLSMYLFSAKILYNKSLKSIVEVKANTRENVSFGTAIFISKNELITNYHVVSYTHESKKYIHENIFIRFSNSMDYIKANIKKCDEKKDLAIINLENFIGTKINVNKSNINTGDEVFLIGNANNLGISLTKGIISKSEVNIKIGEIVNKYIQVDATSSNGVSGGALLSSRGKLLGIITLRLLDDNSKPIYGYVYVIPIDVVFNFVNQK